MQNNDIFAYSISRFSHYYDIVKELRDNIKDKTKNEKRLKKSLKFKLDLLKEIRFAKKQLKEKAVVTDKTENRLILELKSEIKLDELIKELDIVFNSTRFQSATIEIKNHKVIVKKGMSKEDIRLVFAI